MKNVIRRTLLSLLFFPLPAAHAMAAAQHLTYEVYAGGINALTSTLDLDTTSPRYTAVLKAQTQGLLGHLVPWSGTFSASGWQKDHGDLQLESYDSSTLWHGKIEEKIFRYEQDGKFDSLTLNEGGKQIHTAQPENTLVDGATDALTATLEMMTKLAASGGSCNASADVFDGLRRFKLEFHDLGIETLPKATLNVYAGPARRCTVEVVPVAGKWHEKPRGWLSIQEQGRKIGSLPTVWLAPVEKGGMPMPVKVQVMTDYGTLFMQLSHYDDGKTALTPDQAQAPEPAPAPAKPSL